MKKHITFLTFLWADGPSGSVLESFLKGLCLQSPIYEAEDRRFDGLLQLQMQKAEKLLSAITDRRRRMRQKQSKENSRKHHQKSSPAVKREAESLSISTNTIEKNEKARLESRITSGMSYSVSEKEYDKKLAQELVDRYERYRKILKDLTLMSDSFMRAVLKNPKCTEEVLRIILNKNQLQVIDQRLQADYKNLQGRSAILDCVAVEREHNLYNVEIQQKREGASPKRARYHSGLLDMNFLEAGEAYQKLPTGKETRRKK